MCLFDFIIITSVILIDVFIPSSFETLTSTWMVVFDLLMIVRLTAMHVMSCHINECHVEYDITSHHIMYLFVHITCHITTCHMMHNVYLSDQAAALSIFE